jgi:hypothetical protein
VQTAMRWKGIPHAAVAVPRFELVPLGKGDAAFVCRRGSDGRPTPALATA